MLWALLARGPSLPSPRSSASEDCGTCHEAAYTGWKRSHHALAERTTCHTQFEPTGRFLDCLPAFLTDTAVFAPDAPARDKALTRGDHCLQIRRQAILSGQHPAKPLHLFACFAFTASIDTRKRKARFDKNDNIHCTFYSLLGSRRPVKPRHYRRPVTLENSVRWVEYETTPMDEHPDVAPTSVAAVIPGDLYDAVLANPNESIDVVLHTDTSWNRTVGVRYQQALGMIGGTIRTHEDLHESKLATLDSWRAAGQAELQPVREAVEASERPSSPTLYNRGYFANPNETVAVVEGSADQMRNLHPGFQNTSGAQRAFNCSGTNATSCSWINVTNGIAHATRVAGILASDITLGRV